jgi:acetolactate synthase-1/3 small subunit
VTDVELHTFAVLVDNEPGVLARVIGLFSGRGYNIESLTVAEVDPIRAQLDRLVPVRSVRDLTVEGRHLARELALIKVAGSGEKRVESLRIADIFRARVVDSTDHSFVFEVTGSTDKLTAFINLMEPLGLVEVARTGVAAIMRGSEPI